MKQVLSVVLKEQADTLVRLTGLCYRRGVLIESLSYAPEKIYGHVRVKAVLACARPDAEQLRRHVSKMVDVVRTEVTPHLEGSL